MRLNSALGFEQWTVAYLASLPFLVGMADIDQAVAAMTTNALKENGTNYTYSALCALICLLLRHPSDVSRSCLHALLNGALLWNASRDGKKAEIVLELFDLPFEIL